MEKKRSPLKANPLRNPGQSLDEQRLDLAYDELLTPSAMALMLLLLAAIEWWRYFVPSPPRPILFSLFAVGGLGYAIYKVRRAWPKLRALRQASHGEKIVGQFLESLRERGYRVFHDVAGEGFNLDHVLVGPAGVFTIETKTLSKPARGEAKVFFDGERLLINGLEPDRDPLVQAKAQARWLGDLLADSTGRRFRIWPVVLFPGWYVDEPHGLKRELWVLNPKALPAFLDHEAKVLEPEDVQLASFHLSRFIRGCDEKNR
ncbi:MAG: NERD domain-containing protein [Betaproteobacteria bacterium]|nr:NERD domain-containing protein [Betaproteobacteria bacterium]